MKQKIENTVIKAVLVSTGIMIATLALSPIGANFETNWFLNIFGVMCGITMILCLIGFVCEGGGVGGDM